MRDDFTRCGWCGDTFDNVFEYVEHFTEGEDFDPSLILPDGYSLKIGSLLRDIYFATVKKDYKHVKELVQATYHILFVAEMGEPELEDFLQDKEVRLAMLNFDREIRKMLDEAQEDRG